MLPADLQNRQASLETEPARAAKLVYLETFGCQMNELDSELVRGSLHALGYRFTTRADSADVVLYNTCSVREQAENKVWSRVGLMGRRKMEGSRFVLGVIGCMAEREGADMLRRFPQVDLMCGPGELDRLPLLIDNVLKTDVVDLTDRVALQGNTSRRSSTLAAAGDNLEMLDLSRAFDPDLETGAARRSAYVRITRGCNKFCTYCVVPYTRGAEVHRPPTAIVDECRRLADAGVIEITLLGQTVNHYHYVHGAAVSLNGTELPQVGAARPRVNGASAATSFADLLQRIHDQVPAIRRLRFVTSYPRDFGDDILQVMAACPRICQYLHVPAQSGSNRILKLMNRGYVIEQYLEFIERARRHLPDACFGGDIIVGFPTETEEDFEKTKSLLRRVPFKNNFIFKYSPRPGTVAIERFADDVDESVKRRRNNELLALQSEVSAAVHRQWVGRTVDVFIERIRERPASRDPSTSHADNLRSARVKLTIGQAQAHRPQEHRTQMQATGRTAGDLIVAIDLPSDHQQAADLPGTILRARIDRSGPLILFGSLEKV